MRVGHILTVLKKDSNSGMWAKCKKCGHEL